ncbi:MAG: DegV family protein [Lachnospiraceae bacterium]|nr:DegV family protein [Lachnospiraceae bacterium]
MIQIVTDSTCDLDKDAAARLGIHIIPLTLHFGDSAYVDGVTLDRETFYDMLSRADKLPTTSQLNPMDILDVVSPMLEQGDEVIGIFLSSKLSGTFQSATIAAAMSESDRFHLVDSKNVTFGLALLVQVACRCRGEGQSAAQIIDTLENLKGRVRLVAMVDTLKYLQMGGRISAASAVMGSLLGINPLVGVIDGAVEAIGKARGHKAAFRHILTLCGQDAPDPDYPIFFGHTHAPEAMEELKNLLLPTLDQPAEIYSAEIGSVIGTHVGPGAAGLAYIAG